MNEWMSEWTLNSSISSSSSGSSSSSSSSSSYVIITLCIYRIQDDLYYYYYVDEGFDPDVPLPKQKSQRQLQKPDSRGILSELKRNLDLRRVRPRPPGRPHQKDTRVIISLLLMLFLLYSIIISIIIIISSSISVRTTILGTLKIRCIYYDMNMMKKLA